MDTTARRDVCEKPSASGQPDFSIIIPTRNRPKSIVSCLESIARLDYPASSFEVVVVDDGSAVPIAPLADRSADKVNIRVIAQENRGPAAARNRGADEANGTYLAFTDDDCAPSPDWLTRLAARLESTPDRAIGGRTINALPENSCSAASQDLVAYLYEYYNADRGHARFLTSNNIVVPAQLFEALGGFDTGYPKAAAEDRDFCDRWLGSGHGLVYAPEAVVYHRHRMTLRTFWRQHFGYGRGAHRFQRGQAQRSEEGHRFEPPAFYVGMLRYPYSKSRGWLRSSLLTSLIVLSQLGNALGFFWEAAHRSLKRASPRDRL